MWIDHIVYQNSGDLWCLILRNKADVISVPDFFLGTVGSSQTVKYSTLGPAPHEVYQAFPEGEIE
jgi:hypothetical protein